MLSRQEEEQERRETLENDRKVREAERQRILREGTTFHQFVVSHANDEAGGRFAAVNAATVTGTTPVPSYPAASAHQADPVPTEPPLGYDINEMPALEESSASRSASVEATDAPAGAALPLSSESGDAGASFSSSRDEGDR